MASFVTPIRWRDGAARARARQRRRRSRDLDGPASARRRVRARRRRAARDSRPNPPVERVDFEADAQLVEQAARAGRPPRRTLLRRRRRAARGGAPPGGDRVAHRHRAAGDTGGRGNPGRRRLRRGRPAAVCVGLDGRPGHLPAPLPARGRLGVRPAAATAARARAGRPRARRGARPVGGGRPAGRARRRAVPQARRLRRPPSRVRRDLRRPRARARRGASRAARFRPRRPAPPGVQRPTRRLRSAFPTSERRDA